MYTYICAYFKLYDFSSFFNIYFIYNTIYVCTYVYISINCYTF